MIKQLSHSEKNLFESTVFSCSDLNPEFLLKEWSKKKKRTYELFNNKLIVDLGVVNISSVNFFVEDKRKNFIKFITDILLTDKKEEIFKDSVDSIDFFFFLKNIVDDEGFMFNRLSFNYQNFSKGMKFSKSLKLFFNEPYLENIQNKYSILIQEISQLTKKLHLYISIHPMDFLTISNNGNNWDSCHELIYGEHRGGNFEYLIDEGSFVVYLAKEEHSNYEGLPVGEKWNSKIYRRLGNITYEGEDIGVALSREYPNSNVGIHEVLKSYFSKCFFNKELKTIRDSDGQYIIEKEKIIFNQLGMMLYSDFDIDASSQMVLISNPSIKYVFELGEKILCPNCGENIATEGDCILCSKCGTDY